MSTPEPLYRIIYSNGAAGDLWSWADVLTMIRVARGTGFSTQPVRVERVR